MSAHYTYAFDFYAKMMSVAIVVLGIVALYAVYLVIERWTG